jgi:hypothetical protein
MLNFGSIPSFVDVNNSDYLTRDRTKVISNNRAHYDADNTPNTGDTDRRKAVRNSPRRAPEEGNTSGEHRKRNFNQELRLPAHKEPNSTKGCAYSVLFRFIWKLAK